MYLGILQKIWKIKLNKSGVVKLGKSFQISMFVTSFIPLWITILFQDFLNLYRANSYIGTELISVVVIFLINTVAIIIILRSLNSIKYSEYKSYRVIDVKRESGVTNNFAVTYIAPLIIFDFTRWDSVVPFILYFFFLMFHSYTQNVIYANIIFEVLHYKFYNCELQWKAEPTVNQIQALVLSKNNLHAQKGNTVEVAKLNSSFYINNI